MWEPVVGGRSTAIRVRRPAECGTKELGIRIALNPMAKKHGHRRRSDGRLLRMPNTRPVANIKQCPSEAYLVGGGIASLASAAYLIRDGSIPGENTYILEETGARPWKSGRRRPRRKLATSCVAEVT